ncbi:MULTISPECIES: MocR-like pyridoxine biosynthesis transcription factor PdxR [Deefgea]|uniref:Putative 8-amino-7-oxononanoate synthase n=1 Tax=Deefgea chitinilytica TaxID=570276 RepID=A0ABS2CDI1_9NEIS|nr:MULTISPECIES: PLP-dependent aminotransferase family protein [Deefgea]MBM5572223.1 aminotransferase class I/II-fold pyridoxal phosphate-dependent enzyme [Deefgea chitinilytica]MBM9889458.1 PLP-dependent aminotransferase family protein [Deefgea sp. CFH1-16]
MSALPILFAAESQPDLPLHEQLTRTLRRAILAGHLPLDSRLPATRVLAQDLQVSRSTVELAFSRLEAEGYLRRQVGVGSFVAIAAQPSKPRPRKTAAGLSQRGQLIVAAGSCRDATTPFTAFTAGQPDPTAFPRELWGKLTQQRWKKDGERLMRYGDSQGLPELREAIAGYLAQSRGVACDAAQILVLTSSQQALQLIAQLLIDPNDTVWLEEPGYLGARNAMRSAGAKIIPVPVDHDGINTDLSSTLLPPKLIYTTPSHQYPLGVTMSLPRRMALLEQANQHNAWIIEDDYDSEFSYDQRPLPALQGLDQHGRVIYVGTFSKVLFPSLRIAYLVLPPDLMPAFANARAAFDGHTPQLAQAVTADFMTQGHFAAHIRQMRLLYRSRRDLLVDCLQPLASVIRPVNVNGGLQFAVEIEAERESQWTAAGQAQGLALRPLSQFYYDKVEKNGWLLGYAALSNIQISTAVDTLKKCLRSVDSV